MCKPWGRPQPEGGGGQSAPRLLPSPGSGHRSGTAPTVAKREAAPAPGAWGNHGSDGEAQGCPVPPSMAGASPRGGGDEPPGAPHWICPVGLGCGTQHRQLRGSPVPSAVVPSAGAGPPVHGDVAGSEVTGDLAGSQRHCPAWPVAKGQCHHRRLRQWRKDKHVSPVGDNTRDKLGLEGAPLPPRAGSTARGTSRGRNGVTTRVGSASGGAHVRAVTAAPPGACGAAVTAPGDRGTGSVPAQAGLLAAVAAVCRTKVKPFRTVNTRGRAARGRWGRPEAAELVTNYLWVLGAGHPGEPRPLPGLTSPAMRPGEEEEPSSPRPGAKAKVTCRAGCVQPGR